MTAAGNAILEHQRQVFAQLEALEKNAPAEVDQIVAVMVAHLRSWRPETVSPLGALGPPTEEIRDPRDEVAR